MLAEIPRKIQIIVNPGAGGGKGRTLFPLLRKKLLERNLSFHLQFSQSPDHITHLTRQAQGEGFHWIIVCGGDGTAHYALQAMTGSRGVLGIIPLGTGNDLARNLGIPEDLDLACDLLLKGKIHGTDVIQVDSGPYLAGVAGVGFDSEVNALANKFSRYLPGKAAYVLPVLLKSFTYRPKKISLRLDHEHLQGPILMVAFGNTRSYGRGMQITPRAAPDDGLLDVCWIDPVKTFRLCRFFPTVFSGEHLRMPEVRYSQSATARVESPVPLDLYGDGEFLGQTPFTLRIRPRSLEVLVP